MIDAVTNNVATRPVVTTPIVSPPLKKGPGKWQRVLGAVAGAGLNIVAPGAGTLIGEFIGGTGFDPEAMIRRMSEQSMAMLSIQEQMQAETQKFTIASNLLKARHEADMSAVHNLKS